MRRALKVWTAAGTELSRVPGQAGLEGEAVGRGRPRGPTEPASEGHLRLKGVDPAGEGESPRTEGKRFEDRDVRT